MNKLLQIKLPEQEANDLVALAIKKKTSVTETIRDAIHDARVLYAIKEADADVWIQYPDGTKAQLVFC